jgi:gliding motility-associated-like protein
MTYLWSTGETSQSITSTSGVTNYSVIVTSSENCSKTKNFTIIENTIPLITQVFIEGTTATIITSGSGDFDYSIDGVNYQTSNVFYNLIGGMYTAYVRDTYFCGGDFKPFVVITFPAFFTPNNDSFNDFWSINGMVYFPNAEVAIFDRYGKLIAKLNNRNPLWDGTFNNEALLATDYWFVFKKDAISTEIRGHFSLLR